MIFDSFDSFSNYTHGILIKNIPQYDYIEFIHNINDGIKFFVIYIHISKCRKQ
jgi:hypothetical protein